MSVEKGLSFVTSGNPNEPLFYGGLMAICFGLAADVALNGRQTGAWLIYAALFGLGFWYSYSGGKL